MGWFISSFIGECALPHPWFSGEAVQFTRSSEYRNLAEANLRTAPNPLTALTVALKLVHGHRTRIFIHRGPGKSLLQVGVEYKMLHPIGSSIYYVRNSQDLGRLFFQDQRKWCCDKFSIGCQGPRFPAFDGIGSPYESGLLRFLLISVNLTYTWWITHIQWTCIYIYVYITSEAFFGCCLVICFLVSPAMSWCTMRATSASVRSRLGDAPYQCMDDIANWSLGRFRRFHRGRW